MTQETPITGSTVINLKDQMRVALQRPQLYAIIFVVAVFGIALLLPTPSVVSIILFGSFILLYIALFVGAVAFSYRRLSNEQKQVSYEINDQSIAVRDATGAVVVFPWGVVRRLSRARLGSQSG